MTYLIHLNLLGRSDFMKFEVCYTLIDGSVKRFTTIEYDSYNPEKKLVNGLYQIGFVKEGKSRKTWIPFKCGKQYMHNVLLIKIFDASSGKIIDSINTDLREEW